MSKNEKTFVSSHCFCFNPEDNGGESLLLDTEFHDNGDDKDNIYLQQTITLNSYCNNVSINLSGAQITPEKLRQLANELERERNKIPQKTVEKRKE